MRRRLAKEIVPTRNIESNGARGVKGSVQRNSHAPTRNIQPNRTRRVQVPCRGNHTRRPRTANRAESEKSRCRAVEVARADQKQVRPLRCAVARRRMLGRAFKSSRGAIVACNVKPLRQRQQVERIWEWTIELPSVGSSFLYHPGGWLHATLSPRGSGSG